MAHIFQYESGESCMEISAEELHEIYQAAIPYYKMLDMEDKVQECRETICLLEDVIAEEE